MAGSDPGHFSSLLAMTKELRSSATTSALVALEPEDLRAFAARQQTRIRVELQLGPRVGDVEIAHGELADAVGRREGCVLDLLHAEPLRRIGQIGAFGVQNRVVIAAAKLQSDLAGDGARDPAL